MSVHVRALEEGRNGEMVALDSDGRPDFGLLQELSGMRGLGVKRRERRPARADENPRDGTIVYHAFDLLRLDGLDLTDLPLAERKRLLRLLLREHPAVRYVTHIDGTVGFELGEYDATHTLVIDPILNWTSYFGGTGNESAKDIVVDAGGNIYIAGDSTISTSLPTTAGPFGTTGAQEEVEP